MQSEKICILCVDDEPSILKSLKAQLRGKFASDSIIETTDDPREVPEIIRDMIRQKFLIPILISDEIMPKMRGHELLKIVHKDFPHIRSILLTGQAELSSVQSAVNEANLFRYLNKPWEEIDLIMTIKAGIESFRKDHYLEKQLIAFHRFVPRQHLQELGLQEITNVKAGLGIQKDISILFSDIRGFTGLSEKLSSEEIFFFLNRYLELTMPIALENSGIIDNFIGDAVMIFFQDPGAAVRTASKMVVFLRDNAAKRDISRVLELPPGEFMKEMMNNKDRLPFTVRIGAGINSGKVSLGTIGQASRLQTTAIGDAVNTASRLESMTKLLHTPILVSESTQNLLDTNEFPSRFLGKFRVRGKLERVGIYQILSCLSDDELRDIEKGFNKFKEISEAVEMDESNTLQKLTAEYISEFPEDKVAIALHGESRQHQGSAL